MPASAATPNPTNLRVIAMTDRNWNGFNDAEQQQSGFDLIPKGHHRAGAHDHQARWL